MGSQGQGTGQANVLKQPRDKVDEFIASQRVLIYAK
jgi:hypothetical protein